MAKGAWRRKQIQDKLEVVPFPRDASIRNMRLPS